MLLDDRSTSSNLEAINKFAEFDYVARCLSLPHSSVALRQPGLIPWDPINWPILSAMIGVCYVVSLELIFRVFYTLRGMRGLYYWALLAGALGCTIHETGSLVHFMVPGTPSWLGTALIILGWWGLIVGQSLVLYSRINLVVDNKKVLWAIRIMIGFTFVAFLVPCPIATVMANYSKPGDDGVLLIWSISERAQLFGFMISELSMNATYVLATWRVLQTCQIFKIKKVIRFLILMNLFIAIGDVVVITVQGLGWYTLQATLKPCVYALKFKLEFAFLNQLYYLTKEGYRLVGAYRGQRDPASTRQWDQEDDGFAAQEAARKDSDGRPRHTREDLHFGKVAKKISELRNRRRGGSNGSNGSNRSNGSDHGSRQTGRSTGSDLASEETHAAAMPPLETPLSVTQQVDQINNLGPAAVDGEPSRDSSVVEALPQWHKSGLTRRRSVENIESSVDRLLGVHLHNRSMSIRALGGRR